MSSYLVRAALALFLLTLCNILHPRAAQAEEYSVDASDPSLVQAGETVLLSLSGQFPEGELTVEFFPQRITVVSSYTIDRQALAVQISVPLDAPAGKYNILVYNQDGDEALGAELVELQRKARVPKITGAAPLEVDAGLAEVKLSLRCDILDSEALAHLRCEWTMDGKPQADVTSSFSRGGVNTIALTLGGAAPAGVALGKVFFDTTPIYLIRLTRVSTEWSLFGHRPARVTADSPGFEITLIGEALTPQALAGATARLSGESSRPISVAVDWLDASRARAGFSPIPPPGDYRLEVEQGGVVVYQGPLLILAARDPEPEHAEAGNGLPGEPAASPGPASPTGATAGDAESQHPQWEEAQSAPPEVRPAPPVEPEAQPADTPDPAVAQQPETSVPEGEASLAEPAAASGVQLFPPGIDSSKRVFRVEIAGFALPPGDLELFTASLEGAASEAQLMFMGLGEERLILLFEAPESGWEPGATYILSITAREGALELLNATVKAS